MAKILIVDDEQGLRESLEILLKKEGYEATAVGTAIQAQQLLNSDRFDIVITDIYMPRITGVELLKSITTLEPAIKVILITGNPTFETAAEAIRTGAFDYIAKPVSKRQLLKTVQNAVKMKILEDENRKYKMNLEKLVREQTREIRKSEKRYRLLAENASDLIWTMDLGFNITYLSPSVTRILGHRPEDVTDSLFRQVLTQASYNKALKFFKLKFPASIPAGEVDDLNAPRVIELEHIRKDGRSLWMELKINYAFDGAGKPVGIQGLSRDISERKRIELELMEREKNFRNLAENAIDGIIITRAEEKNVYANQQAVRITGYNKDALLNVSMEDLLAPEVYMNIVNLYRLQNFSEDEKNRYESIILTKSGKRIPVEFASTKTIWQGDMADLIFIRDISERKTAERRSLTEKNKARQYLDIVDVIIVALNEKQEVTLVNRKGCEVLGYTEDEILGKNWFANFLPKEEYAFVVNMYKKFLSGALEPLHYNENKVITKKGEERIIAWRNVPLHDEHGNITGTLSSGEDITDRLSMEIKLRSSESRLTTIINSNTDGIIVLNSKEKILFVNPAGEEILGKKSKDLFGKPFGFNLSIEKTSELEIFNNSKESVVVELKVVNIEWGGKPAFLVVIRNITEQKIAKNNILGLTQFQKSIIDNANVWLYVMEPDLSIVVWNKAAENLSGYEQDEVVGSNNIWKSLYPDLEYRERVFSNIQQHLDNNEIIENLETSINNKNGEQKSILWYVRNMNYSGARGGRILALGRDITQQKETEEELSRSFDKIKSALEGAIKAVVLTLETKDPYTSGHQKKVAYIAKNIALELGLDEDTAEAVYIAGSMHDIGKISVPAEILSKPGRLTEPEFSIIKEHSKIGYNILEHIDFPWPIADIILQHHEACDGSGYPYQLTKDQIRIEAKILAVADVIEAISSDRPYRPALGLNVAIEEITRNSGRRFDEKVVNATLRLFNEKKFTFNGKGN